ncbi:Mce associated membrane protein [Mycolicibacterium monacense DSM 44395]|uniref:Mce protein n=1 Tax=Mycobacterium sp. (strain JLS) TaxID=164757 RepID=A0A5Q5CL57_MYCSJ|nr:hypothetical protein [Mycolicibacterium monacense]MDA4104794.1 Mce associated membrane protein [Mycolicibacterium monacense DSM 44395]
MAPDESVVESESSSEELSEASSGGGDEADATEEDIDGPRERAAAPKRLALVAGLSLVIVLGALSGWLGYQAYQSHEADKQRREFVQVARQGALNLTTIDYEHADTDVQRILESATGQFHDDFAQRSQPFLDVVKQAQSKSVGTITEAALESESGDEAQVIVAVTVKTSNVGAAEQEPRAWRMRLTVQKVGEDMKVSNVGFVP